MKQFFTMIHRWITCRCMYCGRKKQLYPKYEKGIDLSKTTRYRVCQSDQYNIGCTTFKRFFGHKEAKVQDALGLLHNLTKGLPND